MPELINKADLLEHLAEQARECADNHDYESMFAYQEMEVYVNTMPVEKRDE